MKRLLIIGLSLLTLTTAKADIHWGIRGGYNATTLSLSQKNWSTDDRNGFYVGPTVKIGILGIGMDMSAIYDQRTLNSNYHADNTYAVITNKRKTFSIPINLRYTFGFGDNLNVFAFAGPQFDFSLNKDIHENGYNYAWEKNTYSINIGAGVTLLSHLEIRANYNIPCGNTSTLNFGTAIDNAYDGIKCKTGAWQIGAAIYF